MKVTPHDVAKRVEHEYPGVEITLSNIQGLDADFTIEGTDMKAMRAAQKRVQELAGKARMFNAHFDVGHCERKTNWWKR
jgi:hypothetical protein